MRQRRTKARAAKPSVQPALRLNTWGGRRAGAGRPRVPGSGVPHLERSRLASRHPVHVTTRMLDIRTLRHRRCYRVVRDALAAGAERGGFRVVEFSVQTNHLHLICEAKNREALARGLQSLFIRIARRLNRALGRKGKVFADRYHDHVLKTPRQVRNALAYVLNNYRRHLAQRGRRQPRGWIDPCSSAGHFFGLDDEAIVAAPHTWLLSGGWRRAGPVRIDAVPAGST